MKVLVTGADGFVGTALCDHLQAGGHSVHRIVRAAAHANVTAVGDFTGFTGWDALLQGVECVVHVAGRAHVLHETVADPLHQFRQVNVEPTMRLARAAAASGVRRLVFVSSIGVNGVRTLGKPFAEADAPQPVEPYALSKWEAEQGLLQIAAGSRLQVTRIRPPLIVGPGAKGNLRRLMRLVASGFPLPLDGVHNSRSYVALENLCGLISLCAAHEGAAGQLFLAAEQERLSTANLLRILAEGMGRRARVFALPASLMAFAARLAGIEAEWQRMTSSLEVDASHALETLGWRPAISLRTAVLRMAAAYLREKQAHGH